MLLYISLNIFSLLLLYAGYQFSRLSKKGSLGVIIIALTLICFKAILHWKPVLEAWLFSSPDYAYIQQYLLYPISMLFFGLAAAKLPVLWNRIIIICLGIIVLTYGGYENCWIAFPENHGRKVYADNNHHIQQNTTYTCGPCACISALSYLNIKISEMEMARLCLTTYKNGTKLFNIYRGLLLALNNTKYYVEISNLHPEDLLKKGQIVVTSNMHGFHAICVIGLGDRVRVHNPLFPKPVVCNLEEIKKEYYSPAVIIKEKLP